MKIHIPTWLTDTLKDFRKEIIRFLIVSGGLGAVILAYVTGIGTHLFVLISNHIVITAVLILFSLFYLLGRANVVSRINKNKPKHNEPTIVQHELMQFDRYKWDVTVYSNGHFEISNIPYCAQHDLRLVKKTPLYFCPRFDECHLSISYRDIPFIIGNLESFLEKQLREQHTQQ